MRKKIVWKQKKRKLPRIFNTESQRMWEVPQSRTVGKWEGDRQDSSAVFTSGEDQAFSKWVPRNQAC